MCEMSKDTKSIVKSILCDAIEKQDSVTKSTQEALEEHLDNGTLTGSSSGRVKKMADSIIALIQGGNEPSED